jgi:hypothetical protein
VDYLLESQSADFDASQMGGETEFARSVTAALLGWNSTLNPSNVVILIIDPPQIRDGLLVDYFGNPYNFQYVKSDRDSRRPHRIVVCSSSF